MLLALVGILFSVAMLLAFIDKMTDFRANLDLRRPVRILLFVAMVLIIFNFYRNQQKTKNTEKPLVAETAVPE